MRAKFDQKLYIRYIENVHRNSTTISVKAEHKYLGQIFMYLHNCVKTTINHHPKYRFQCSLNVMLENCLHMVAI